MPENVVWLTGMPRSGTNWFAQIFASHPDVRLKLCPLFSYEFKNACNEQSGADEWHSLFRQVYRTPGEYLDQEYLRREGLVPAFDKSGAEPPTLAIKTTRYHHLTEGLLEKCPEIRVVGIIRHPCAAIHSWLSNPLEFPAGADPMQEWRSGACRKTGVGEFWGFDDWKLVAGLFIRLATRFPERFRIARYEAFVRQPEVEVLALFDWLGLTRSEQTLDFLRQSHSRHDQHNRSVFKNPAVSSRWRRELAPAITDAILQELAGTPLAQFLIDGDA